MIQTRVVPVTTVATVLYGPITGGFGRLIPLVMHHDSTSVSVWIGDQTVTVTTGFEIHPTPAGKTVADYPSLWLTVGDILYGVSTVAAGVNVEIFRSG